MKNASDTLTKKTKKYIHGLGRRKRAIANVFMFENGSGKFNYNTKDVIPNKKWITPLEVVGMNNKFDFKIRTSGGGIMGQEEAVRLGIARALVSFDKTFQTTLRGADLLTRDPREKERKKPGLRRARRAPQWAKR